MNKDYSLFERIKVFVYFHYCLQFSNQFIEKYTMKHLFKIICVKKN